MEQALLVEMIERNADGVLVLDADGRVIYANQAVGKLLGRRTEELMGEPFGAPVAGGETSEMEIFTRGEERIAELRAVEFRWHNEPATLVSLRDITLRKQAEEQQQAIAIAQTRQAEAEERAARAAFLADVANALEGSENFEPNLPQLCTLCSSSFADWCAIDIILDGLLRREACSADDRDELLAALEHLEDDEPSLERLATDRAGRLSRLLPGEWNGAHVLRLPIRSRGRDIGAFTALRKEHWPFGPKDVELAREVARRTAVSVEQARLYHDAREASRAKSDFLAVISHELRTPLNAIIGYAQLMEERISGGMTPAQQRNIQKIEESSSHLLQLVNQILTYVQIESGDGKLDLHDVSLEEILRGAASVAEPRAHEAGLRFAVNLPDGDAQLFTDVNKLRQVLGNLLDNAIKFTPQGSIELSGSGGGDWCRIEISDTGIGMDEEELQQLFDPFWQAEPACTRRAGGTGLGASVAQRLVRLLGGSLAVHSSRGEGTRCVIMIPRRYSQRA